MLRLYIPLSDTLKGVKESISVPYLYLMAMFAMVIGTLMAISSMASTGGILPMCDGQPMTQECVMEHLPKAGIALLPGNNIVQLTGHPSGAKPTATKDIYLTRANMGEMLFPWVKGIAARVITIDYQVIRAPSDKCGYGYMLTHSFTGENGRAIRLTAYHGEGTCA